MNVRFAIPVRIGALFGSGCGGLVPDNVLFRGVNGFQRRAEGRWRQPGYRQGPTKRTYMMSFTCEYKSSDTAIMLESLPQPDVDMAKRKLGEAVGD